jgi:hypothetical protein
VTFAEDASRVRIGSDPHAMACLRSLAIGVLEPTISGAVHSREVMRINDQVALAAAAQDALGLVGELTECAQFGDGWSCTQPATPDGPAQLIGRDDRGGEVWMRRNRCAARHWYDLETPAPDRTV